MSQQEELQVIGLLEDLFQEETTQVKHFDGQWKLLVDALNYNENLWYYLTGACNGTNVELTLSRPRINLYRIDIHKPNRVNFQIKAQPRIAKVWKEINEKLKQQVEENFNNTELKKLLEKY